MTKEFIYNFKFKGNRDYIQGPDIVDESIKMLSSYFDISDINEFKYSGHQMLNGNAVGYLSGKPQNEFNSMISFKYQGSMFYLSVIRDSRQINSRVEFSEDPIRSELQTDSLSCKMKYNPSFTLTEQIISMNKHFLQKTISNEGKWIVTKLEYPKIIEAVTKLQEGSVININLEKNMKNRLTRSSVKYNDDFIGNVFFCLI